MFYNYLFPLTSWLYFLLLPMTPISSFKHWALLVSFCFNVSMALPYFTASLHLSQCFDPALSTYLMYSGETLCIVSPKPQTTRHRILGVLTEEKYQLVFSDTPGMMEPVYKLQEAMMDSVSTDISHFATWCIQMCIRQFNLQMISQFCCRREVIFNVDLKVLILIT